MRILAAIIVLLVLVSCKKKLVEPPENLIPEDKMTELLFDLALLKGLKTNSPTTMKAYKIETMPYIYEKYGVDSVQFVRSDQYYASVPEIYQRMYQKIEDSLSAKIKRYEEAAKERNNNAREQSEKIKDSLRKKAKGVTTELPPKK